MRLKCGCSFDPFKMCLCEEVMGLFDASALMEASGQMILKGMAERNGWSHLLSGVNAGNAQQILSIVSRFVQNVERKGCYREGSIVFVGRQK